jgi:hypothetical protein
VAEDADLARAFWRDDPSKPQEFVGLDGLEPAGHPIEQLVLTDAGGMPLHLVDFRRGTIADLHPQRGESEPHTTLDRETD